SQRLGEEFPYERGAQVHTFPAHPFKEFSLEMQGDGLMADAPAAFEDRTDKSLLIVDDDRPFSTRLARAMEGRGYQVRVAESVTDGLAAIETEPPAFAVIDMRLSDGNGLDVIERLKIRRP